MPWPMNKKECNRLSKVFTTHVPPFLSRWLVARWDKHSSDPSIHTRLLSGPLGPLTQQKKVPFRIDAAAPTFWKQVAHMAVGGRKSQHFL